MSVKPTLETKGKNVSEQSLQFGSPNFVQVLLHQPVRQPLAMPRPLLLVHRVLVLRLRLDLLLPVTEAPRRPFPLLPFGCQ